MNIVIGTSIGSAVGVYEIVSLVPWRVAIDFLGVADSVLWVVPAQLGITGYLTFGSTVGSNVIAM
jgi:hypothetical protein